MEFRNLKSRTVQKSTPRQVPSQFRARGVAVMTGMVHRMGKAHGLGDGVTLTVCPLSRYVGSVYLKFRKGVPPMARFERKPERTSLAATPKVEPTRPAITLPSSSRTPTHDEPQRRAVSEDDVRLRAYELYLQRGAAPGNEVGDWLRAEQELRAS